MMTLQSNVSLQWPSLVVGQVANELTIQSHFNVRSGGFNFKSVPFTERLRR